MEEILYDEFVEAFKTAKNPSKFRWAFPHGTTVPESHAVISILRKNGYKVETVGGWPHIVIEVNFAKPVSK